MVRMARIVATTSGTWDSEGEKEGARERVSEGERMVGWEKELGKKELADDAIQSTTRRVSELNNNSKHVVMHPAKECACACPSSEDDRCRCIR